MCIKWRTDLFYSNYSVLENWRYASHRSSGALGNGETVPDIFDFCFFVFLFHVRKPSRPLCTSPPKTGRLPADPGYGFSLQRGTDRDTPGSEDGLFPESAHTSLLPIFLRISSRQRYIYWHRLPTSSRQWIWFLLTAHRFPPDGRPSAKKDFHRRPPENRYGNGQSCCDRELSARQAIT